MLISIGLHSMDLAASQNYCVVCLIVTSISIMEFFHTEERSLMFIQLVISISMSMHILHVSSQQTNLEIVCHQVRTTVVPGSSRAEVCALSPCPVRSLTPSHILSFLSIMCMWVPISQRLT